MNCDMCGQESELFKAIIEGSELNVCVKCSTFGKIIGKAKTAMPGKEVKIVAAPAKPEKTVTIIPNYGKLIRLKREQLGLSQKDFAKKMAEKESIIHKIEVQAIEPDIELAEKFERLLGMKLIDDLGNEEVNIPKLKKNEVTLGDMVKVRKR